MPKLESDTTLCTNCGVYPKQANHAWCKKCEDVFGDGTTVTELEEQVRQHIESGTGIADTTPRTFAASDLHCGRCSSTLTVRALTDSDGLIYSSWRVCQKCGWDQREQYAL